MERGDWRVFVLAERDAKEKDCHEITRVHMMDEPLGVSFGFVEQRVTSNGLGCVSEVQFFVFCAHANLGTDGKREGQRVPSLREGMNIIEWLWNARKGESK